MTLEDVADDAVKQRCTEVPLRQKDIGGRMCYEEKQWYTPLMTTADTPVIYVEDAPIDLVSIAVVAPALGILNVADKVSEISAQQEPKPES